MFDNDLVSLSDLDSMDNRNDDISMRAVSPVWLEGLNVAQREMVENFDGAMLALAGAGTGKTHALVCRVANIVSQKKANPNQVLCVTFTNKTASELKERLERVLGIHNSWYWTGTFHSLCLSILRFNVDSVGLKNNFSILDTSDQVRVLKAVLVELGVDDKSWPAKHMIDPIQSWKDRGLLPKDVTLSDVGNLADGKLGEAYRRYQQRLQDLNAVDFGDLILLCVDLFKRFPDILAQYQAKFKYILVDEYQDINTAQYMWLRLLTSGNSNPNICCVGDDDQSIYGWRGADVSNILNFKNDFPSAHVVKLEQNYRSTQNILHCANSIISCNKNRLGKKLFTQGDKGNKVVVKGVNDGEGEARFVIAEIEKAHSLGEKLSDMAILVRAGFQMRVFEQRFLSIGMGYRVVGSVRFYEREEIRDAIAYLRLLHMTSDDLAFERIINKPSRGIGLATVQMLQIVARAKGGSLYDVSKDIVQTDELSTRAKNALQKIIDLFESWRKIAKSEDNSTVLKAVLQESGFMDYWENSKDEKAKGRIENLQELCVAVSKFENIGGFLEHIALSTALENTNIEDSVSMMTLHSAKGLEFNRVFLVGWEDGLFPSEKSMEETGLTGLEEERRLAYVGITRARENCCITFANSRVVHGRWQNPTPSRFIEELPKDGVDIQLVRVGYGDSVGYGANRPDIGWKPLSDSVDIMESSLSKGFKAGTRCFHAKFGMGVVLKVDNDNLTIEFDNAGTKRVMATFVEKT